jgi:nicotinamide-nucleotide amidase
MHSEAQALGAVLWREGLTLATAESCTGGGIAEALTSVPGSSAWFDRGYVTYSNLSKVEMLGVSEALLDRHGAVSEAVALAMVSGALSRSAATLAVAVTGIAGPGGGTSEKPVGTVWLAFQRCGQAPVARCCHFKGGRDKVRSATILEALKGVSNLAKEP